MQAGRLSALPASQARAGFPRRRAARWGASALVTFASLSGIVVAALVTGLYVRARRAHVAGLTERAVWLELERDPQALLATAAERARISREMPDVVATASRS